MLTYFTPLTTELHQVGCHFVTPRLLLWIMGVLLQAHLFLFRCSDITGAFLWALDFFSLIWSPGMTVNFNCLDFNLLLFNYLQICLNLFDLIKKNVHIYPLIISNIVLVNDSEFYIKTISKVYRIKSVILQKVVWLF